ncbi:uncharacterized protein LOC108145475 isoform X2 [Drosophila elegans]|nr:uncharacterized protein LOC108145475 isoform X2 [Drosophila elegans]
MSLPSRANFGLLNWLIGWLLLLSMVLLRGYSAAMAPTPPTTTTTTISPSNLLPYFDFDVPRNLTVTVGQTGFLHCRVERLGDKDVSWIRKRDLHILTAGGTTYTSDQRFQVLRPDGSANWTLQIKYPQPRDSGVYECQINTEPKMSLSYTFNVVELKAEIFGPSDLMVKTGSDINLTCKIMQGPHELGNIFWYKGSEMLDGKSENEIDSSMARIRVEDDWTDGLTSRRTPGGHATQFEQQQQQLLLRHLLHAAEHCVLLPAALLRGIYPCCGTVGKIGGTAAPEASIANDQRNRRNCISSSSNYSHSNSSNIHISNVQHVERTPSGNSVFEMKE